MSPLNKMKSLSQAGGTTGRFIKALAKLTFGWGHRKSSLQRGSLCIYPGKFLSAAGLRKGCRVSRPAGLLWPGRLDGRMGTHRAKGDGKRTATLAGAGRLQGAPKAEAWPCHSLAASLGPRFPPETRGPCPRRFQFGESPRPGHTAKRLTHAAPTLLRGCCELIHRNDGEL